MLLLEITLKKGIHTVWQLYVCHVEQVVSTSLMLEEKWKISAILKKKSKGNKPYNCLIF